MAEGLKACARCGAGFDCRPGEGCWCEAVALPASAAETLAALHDDCLCPACLAAAGGPEAPLRNRPDGPPGT